ELGWSIFLSLFDGIDFSWFEESVLMLPVVVTFDLFVIGGFTVVTFDIVVDEKFEFLSWNEFGCSIVLSLCDWVEFSLFEESVLMLPVVVTFDLFVDGIGFVSVLF